jgi:hypothetical protein
LGERKGELLEEARMELLIVLLVFIPPILLVGAVLEWLAEHGWIDATDAPAIRWSLPTSAPAGLLEDIRELTESTCRLADGSVGRIAIERRSDEGWTAVCVQV